jgi:hypothetical protein
MFNYEKDDKIKKLIRDSENSNLSISKDTRSVSNDSSIQSSIVILKLRSIFCVREWNDLKPFRRFLKFAFGLYILLGLLYITQFIIIVTYKNYPNKVDIEGKT